MPGRLEPLRTLLKRKPLVNVRDAIVRLAWHLDPSLSALAWAPVDMVLSRERRSEFMSWNKYDHLFRTLRDILEHDDEWRQGPRKCIAIARGPLRGLQFVRSSRLNECEVLDFGCGTHFPDSTGLILYMCGVKRVESVDTSQVKSGFETGAALDLIHWLEDRRSATEHYTIAEGAMLDWSRVREIHRHAVACRNGGGSPFEPVSLVSGDLFGISFHNKQYDLITSNAVLEHVDSPQRVVQRLIELLKVRGCMHHVVDLRDHRSYYRPEEYLPLPSLGRTVWGDPSTNGWRYTDWMRFFAANQNVEVLSCVPEDVQHNALVATEATDESVASFEILLRRVA